MWDTAGTLVKVYFIVLLLLPCGTDTQLVFDCDQPASNHKCHIFVQNGNCVADCRGKNLSEIPELPKSVQFLYLQNNSIPYIDPYVFEGLRNVEHINLTNNYITAIPEETFTSLFSLEALDISHNEINGLTVETLYGAHNLKKIFFANNQIICDCSLIPLMQWITLRNVITDQPSCVNGENIDVWYRKNYPSCPGIFETELFCEEYSSDNDNGSVIVSCQTEKAACYSSITYADNGITLTKGCTNDTVCHSTGQKNNKTCSINADPPLCMICCLQNHCNYPTTFQGIMKTLKFELLVDVIIQNGTNLDNLSMDFNTFLISWIESLIHTYIGEDCLLNVQISNQSDIIVRNGSIYQFDIFCTTFMEIKSTNILSNLKGNLNPAFLLEGVTAQFGNIKEIKDGIISHYCKASKTENENGVFEWKSTKVGTYAKLYCISEHTFQLVPVLRQCVDFQGNAYWLSANTSDCLTSVADLNVTEDNADKFSETLLHLSLNATNFDDADFDVLVSSLDKLLSLENTYSVGKRRVVMVMAIDNLMSTPLESMISAEKSSGAASRLLNAVQQISSNVNISDSNFKVVGSNMALYAMKIDVESYKGMTVIADISQSKHHSRIMDLALTDVAAVNNTTYIQLPHSLVAHLFNNDLTLEPRLAFSVYTERIIFKAIRDGTGNTTSHMMESFVTDINSVVLAASIPGIQVQNLADPVEFRFQQINKYATNEACVYFVEEGASRGQWKESGCHVKTHIPGEYTICVCDHLTNFALLMDIYGKGAGIGRDHKKALSYLSYIGCAVSFIGLMLTLITYFLFRSLRSTIPAKILMNICVTLASVNLIFLIGEQEYALHVDVYCQVVALLLHYFLLAAMMWMLVEAYYFYLTVVMVFRKHIHRFLLKISLFGWGLPLIAVIVTALVNKMKSYGLQAGGICWLQPIAFYAAFLPPFCVMIVVNSVVFVLVMRRILGLHAKNLKKTDGKHTSQRIRGSMTAVVMLGLTWVFAVFALNNDDGGLLFQYLFAICNSLQGFFIFLFHCLLKSEVQKEWVNMMFKNRNGKKSQGNKNINSKSRNTDNDVVLMAFNSSIESENAVETKNPTFETDLQSAK